MVSFVAAVDLKATWELHGFTQLRSVRSACRLHAAKLQAEANLSGKPIYNQL